MYSDSATLLFLFVCLGGPVLSFLFCLPFNLVNLVVSGFMELDDEGVPQSDWLLFKLFGFLTLRALPFLSKVFAWLAVLSLVYVVDNESNALTVVQFFNAEAFDLYAGGYPSFQIAAHVTIVLAAIVVRFAIWATAGVHLEMWLGEHFEKKVFGPQRLKVLTDYTDGIAKRDGFLPAIGRLFS
jgi:hypothetical protein